MPTVEDTDFSHAFIRIEILSFFKVEITFVPSVIDATGRKAWFVLNITQEIKVEIKFKIGPFDCDCHVQEKTNVSELGDFGMKEL